MISKIGHFVLLILDFLFRHSKKGSNINYFAISKAVKIVNTFIEAKKVFYSSLDKEFVLSVMERIAKSFGDWRFIYKQSKEGSDLRSHASSKMKEIGTFGDWEGVYWYSKKGSFLKDCAFLRMQELGTFKNWREVYFSSEDGSQLHTFAFEKLIKLAKTFSDWRFILHNSKRGSALECQAISKMQELGTFGGWESVYNESKRGSALECFAYEEMKRLAKSFSEELIVEEIAKFLSFDKNEC